MFIVGILCFVFGYLIGNINNTKHKREIQKLKEHKLKSAKKLIDAYDEIEKLKTDNKALLMKLIPKSNDTKNYNRQK